MGVSIEELRHRVTFQEPVNTPDGAGGFTTSWNDVVTVWAAIETGTQRVASRERFENGKIESRQLSTLIIRYRDNLNQTMRVLYGARMFEIESIINADERKQFQYIALNELF